MTIRRARVLALFVAAGLGLGACSHSASPVTSSNSASGSNASAKDALAASISPLATTSYAVSLRTATMTAVGSVDPAGGTATVTVSSSLDGDPVNIDVLTIADDCWAKTDLGSLGADMGVDSSKWFKLDMTKVPARGLPFDRDDLTDAFDLAAIVHNVQSVTRTDAAHYAGSVDLTSVTGASSLIPSGSTLAAGAKTAPFTAVLDRQGRLTDFAVTPPAGGGHGFTFDLGISDYDAPEPVKRPDDTDVVAAPEAVYSILTTY